MRLAQPILSWPEAGSPLRPDGTRSHHSHPGSWSPGEPISKETCHLITVIGQCHCPTMLPIHSGKVRSLSVSLIPHIETSLLALALREMEEDAPFCPSGSDVGIHIRFLD